MLRLIKRNQVVCERCGQELTDPESIARGMGEECAMTAAAQFAAISSLSLALSAEGYYDDYARRLLIEKRIVETRLNQAKIERNSLQIIRFTQVLKKLTGQLVRRELHRLERMESRKAVA
jgi:Family of unknown function (DUF6011)